MYYAYEPKTKIEVTVIPPELQREPMTQHENSQEEMILPYTPVPTKMLYGFYRSFPLERERLQLPITRKKVSIGTCGSWPKRCTDI